MKGQKKETRTLVCPICGKTFETHHPHKKYCSAACAIKARNENIKARRMPMSEDEKMRNREKKIDLYISPPRAECFECPFSECKYDRESQCPVLRRANKKEAAK